MELCQINFWLLKNKIPKITFSWSKLMIDDGDKFSYSIFWAGGCSCRRQQLNCRTFLVEWELFFLQDEHTSLLMVYITYVTNRVLTYLLIVTFLCERHQLQPRLQFRSPSCLLVVFPCLETLSKLCWVFSSFRHPPPCKSSLASSSGPRWGRHCPLHQVSCYFVWNKRDYDPFMTVLHAV